MRRFERLGVLEPPPVPDGRNAGRAKRVIAGGGGEASQDDLVDVAGLQPASEHMTLLHFLNNARNSPPYFQI